MRDNSTVRRKAGAIERFGCACQRCGYDRCIRALHFHHIDPSHKKDWSNGRGNAAIAEIEAHPDRFILLCANCHIEEHDRIDRASRMMATCQQCGATFPTHPYRAKDNRGKYCSMQCRDRHRREVAVAKFDERFWKFVDKSGDCWIWTGVVLGGRPIIQIPQSSGGWTNRSSRRVVYESLYGPIPEKTRLGMSCSTVRCVRHVSLSQRSIGKS